MKNPAVLISFLFLSAGLFAQRTIPAGTILPVQLNSSVRSDKARPGEAVTARVMQDVPLPGGSKIRAGAKVIGHVSNVRPAGNGDQAEVSLRFDTVAIGSRRIPIVTNLRALATMMDVSEAQVPVTGPDRGTSEYDWTTSQIGGQVNYHDNGVIVEGSEVVGHSVPNGVLARVSSNPEKECRGDVDGDNHLQPLWVFSSDACGLYGFPGVTLLHAGRTNPVGQITLISKTRNLNIRAGSGMLLRVNNAK